MAIQFKGRNILITGGSKGIGLAVAQRLAQQGANLFLVARKLKVLKEAQQSIKGYGVECEIASCDVGNKAQVKKTVAAMKKKMGSIDGLINNAGFSIPAYFHEAKLADFEKLMQTDYFGSVYFAKEVYPHLKKGDFITFTSSVVGYMGVFGFSSYAGPKFALIGLAEVLEQEMTPQGIQVSVLCPPDTDTPGFEQEEQTKPFETKKLSESAKLMSPDGVAEVFLKKLQKGKFIITCNFESWLFYRLHGAMPGLVRFVMGKMIASAQKARAKS